MSIFERVRELLTGGALAHDSHAGAVDLELRIATVALLLETAERYDAEQRMRIAGLVWKVVYADRIVDDAEVAFATRVAALTGLTPQQCQQARERSYARFSEERHARKT